MPIYRSNVRDPLPGVKEWADTLGLTRRGREFVGPCPLCGGDDRFHVRDSGGRAAVGCRGCIDGQPDGERRARFGELLLAAFPNRASATARSPARVPRTPHAPGKGGEAARGAIAGRLWAAAVPADHTPARAYLAGRSVWPPDSIGPGLPASVRWLPGESARRVGVRPQLPFGADGCVIYRFGAPGEADTFAAQLEAVNAHGERVPFGAAGKRPSVAGSAFAGGRRVFHAGGDPDRAIHVCEGPLDALALVHLEQLGSANLHGGAVHGTPGVSGFQLAACPGRGPVTVWRDRDTNGQGQRAAAQLAGQLRQTGRRVTIHDAPWDGADLNDWARAVVEDREEREAIQHES